jgi:uncharacterized protein
MTEVKPNQEDRATGDPHRHVDDTLFNRLHLHPAMYALLALFGIFILYQIVGGGITLLLFGLDFTDDSVQAIRLATMVGQILFLLIPTLVLIRFQTKNIFYFIRLKPIGFSEVLFITVGVIAAQQFLQGYLVLQDMIPLPEAVQPFVDGIRESIEQMYRTLVMVHTIPELILVIVVVALVPAFSEEILFRGLVQRNFEYSFGLVGGAVMAGIIFALYHLNPFTLVPLMALGIVFGLLVYKTGSIIAAILAHFINNFVAVISVFFRRGEILIPADGDPSIGITVRVMLISALVAVGCWMLLSQASARRHRTEQQE